MQGTDEQIPAIASNARKLLIQAFAGTGKTTTLVGYANAHSGAKMLYLRYNKSVEMAAKNRFPARPPTAWPMRSTAPLPAQVGR